MIRIRKRGRKYLSLVVFFATFSLLSCLAGAAKSAQETGHEAVYESSHESAHESGHGRDRSGDLRDLLYRFINFALLVIILFLAIRKSGIKDSLSARIEEIRQRLDDLKKEKEEAETRYKDIEKRLRDFEEKKKDIVEEFKKEGLAEKEKIIAAAKEKAKQIIEQAGLTVQQEMQSVKDRLRKDVVDLAVQRAEEIISKEITEEDQDRLVNEFIERVGKIH